MNFRLSGQKIRQKTCTKYLGVLIDEHLLFKDHINFLKQKLNRANGILHKLRYHLSSDILKTHRYTKHKLLPCRYTSTLCVTDLGTKQQ